MKYTLATFLSIFALSAFGQESILVSAEWLNEHKSDRAVVILQPSALKYDYDLEHIEGARYLWTPSMSPDSPQGSMNAPDPAKAAEILGGLGISNESKVVLCHVRGDVSQTARMFLVLEQLGLQGKVYFLNGGLEAWKRAGYPVTAEAPVVRKATFKPDVSILLVDKTYVKDHLNSSSTTIVDARAKGAYDGEPVGQPRDGHIAGAKNIPYQEMLDQATFVFKPSTQLQEYFTPVAPKDKELVAYCYIGQTASVVYLAGRILGYNMKLYDGSIQEWSRMKDLPMEKTVKNP